MPSKDEKTAKAGPVSTTVRASRAAQKKVIAARKALNKPVSTVKKKPRLNKDGSIDKRSLGLGVKGNNRGKKPLVKKPEMSQTQIKKVLKSLSGATMELKKLL